MEQAMKIYTKKGDQGLTSLIGGTKVPKSHLRIECYGTVDELNSCLGALRAAKISDKGARATLAVIQERLFVVGSRLACDPARAKMDLPGIEEADAVLLEKEIDRMTAKLPELKSFILPGGSPAAAMCHMARCVCRRAERLVVALSAQDEVDALIIVYLNRLSDYLFVLSRKINKDKRYAEIVWKPRAN
jgi:cob(I)alamin adenosyltransferase